MLYKFWHKLFGWDYIQWSNSVDQGVARVYVSYNGIVYYWRYKVTKLIDVIESPEQVLWLTCSPEKYFSSEVRQFSHNCLDEHVILQ